MLAAEISLRPIAKLPNGGGVPVTVVYFCATFPGFSRGREIRLIRPKPSNPPGYVLKSKSIAV